MIIKNTTQLKSGGNKSPDCDAQPASVPSTKSTRIACYVVNWTKMHQSTLLSILKCMQSTVLLHPLEALDGTTNALRQIRKELPLIKIEKKLSLE